MIITRTPYRISFFGGGSDYPVHYKRHGGCVLGVTIDKYCWLTVRESPSFAPAYRVVYARTESAENSKDITHAAVSECLAYLQVNRAEIHHSSDLPARSGVGSSSAFVVGLLRALHKLKNEGLDKDRLAWEAIEIEQQQLGETVGSQDQVLTAYGGLNLVRFYLEGFKTYPIDRTLTNRLEQYLLLFYTGIQRTASDVAASYLPELPNKVGLLKRLATMADEAADMLVAGGDLTWFGEMLDEAWERKKEVGKAVTSYRLDELYTRGRQAGATGGKVLGAGGGGHLLLFCLPENRKMVVTAMENAGCRHVPFQFEDTGSTVVFDGRLKYDP